MNPIVLDETWQKRRDKSEATVYMHHRRDRLVVLRDQDGERLTLPVRDLRRYWRRKADR